MITLWVSSNTVSSRVFSLANDVAPLAIATAAKKILGKRRMGFETDGDGRSAGTLATGVRRATGKCSRTAAREANQSALHAAREQGFKMGLRRFPGDRGHFDFGEASFFQKAMQ